jgi:hypothetical protein
MGTRGTLGFRKNGVDKLMYNHFDSYPSGLGAKVIEFLKNTSIEEMSAIFDKIEMIDGDVKPTAQQIEECKKWTNLTVSEKSADDWYCLLRDAQGELSAFKEGLRYMLEANDFIKDSLFCEYGYIINLDDNVLEFWYGWQEKPQEGNRYGTEVSKGYYPCRLVKTYPLSDFLHENQIDYVADMEKSLGDENEESEEEVA